MAAHLTPQPSWFRTQILSSSDAKVPEMPTACQETHRPENPSLPGSTARGLPGGTPPFSGWKVKFRRSLSQQASPLCSAGLASAQVCMETPSYPPPSPRLPPAGAGELCPAEDPAAAPQAQGSEAFTDLPGGAGPGRWLLCEGRWGPAS